MKRNESSFQHQAELEKVIEKHLPDIGYEVDNLREAASIRLAYIFAPSRQKAWKSEDEIAKLKKITKSIGAAICESEKLEGLVLAALVGGSLPISDKPEGVISTLRQIEHALKHGIEAASKAAHLGRSRRGQGGHPNVEAISVLRACREIWKRRGGQGSVKTAHYRDPGPFGRFVEAGPCLLVDETDTFLPDNPELVGVLNNGYSRGQAFVIRCDGDDHAVKTFRVWAPKVLCGIGELSDTLASRCITIQMRRRRAGEIIERLRADRQSRAEVLRSRCARWAADNTERLRGADPDMPEVLDDRAQDNWRPLIAIADLVAGETGPCEPAPPLSRCVPRGQGRTRARAFCY